MGPVLPLGSSRYFDLVVFSHLRWDFVYQRPQHLLSRLSKNHKTLFIEEPFATKPQGHTLVRQINRHLSVLQPIAPGIASDAFRETVIDALDQYVIQKPVLWFYSPAFVEMADILDHELVVFDCMDQLTAFKGATRKLLRQEKTLLNVADVVFTGGKSLYKAKSKLHENTFCFPSSVDRDHFKKALRSTIVTPYDLKSVPKPIVGYYGVIDERINPHLIRSVAKQLPNVSFVLVGPVVKINPSTLPKLSNIYYLGQKTYEELPLYLKHFDVAYMPFALNRATEFISPTKTLEYMAAHKPIVSTAITDVVSDYSHVVKVADRPNQMVAAIHEFMNESTLVKQRRIRVENLVLKRSSWDKTAERMEHILLTELEHKHQSDTLIDRSVLGSQLLTAAVVNQFRK